MNFELVPEQQALQKAAIEFARRELNSNMIERDAQQVFSHEAWKKCASFGVQGMPIPNEYGGRGSAPITTIAMMEGLGYGGSELPSLTYLSFTRPWIPDLAPPASVRSSSKKEAEDLLLEKRRTSWDYAPLS